MKKTLRIFSLNVEYGKYSKTLIPYIETLSKEIDVFCFQEAPRDARDTTVFEPEHDAHFCEKIMKVLPGFTPYYSEFVKESFGIITLVRSSLKQKYRDETYIFGDSHVPFLDQWEWNNHTKALSIKVEWVDIMNLHWAWQPGTKKLDTPERILQSKIIRKFTKWRESKTILIGDFNLMPETKSIAILEKKYENLITRYGITNTRTAVFDKPRAYADYAFFGKDIEVRDFSVHLEPIFSDHGFMLLEISYK